MKLLDIYEKSEVFRCAKGGELPMETASLFVSGIVMRELFFSEISFYNKQEGYSFEQIWYAICLHHDKQLERAHIWKKVCQEKRDRGIRRWESRNIDANYKWRPMQLCFSPLFHYSGEGVRFTNGAQVKKCILSESEIKDYFYFRNTCCREGGMDHGIAGGLLLYENFTRRHLQYKGDLDRKTMNLYSYAANSLMVHNICNGDEDGEKITWEKDPLLFLFVLAETLEPLQYAVVCADYSLLLSCIEVDISDREISFVMDPEYFAIDRLEEGLQRMEKKIKVEYKLQREAARIRITM